MNSLPYIKKVMPNGLRYIFIPQPQSMATTALILVSTGSEYETKEINGISHFLEHLSFKGTTNRPKADMIASELDSLGAEYNAFTGNEITGYYAKAANKNFEKILDVVTDLYLNPIIDAAEMDKERGVIIEEINMYEDLPKEKAQENFSALLYGDQPAGWSVAGRKEVIRSLTRDDVISYRSKHYVAGKTTVVISGGIDFDPEEMVLKHFADMTVAEVIKKPKTIESQKDPQINLFNKKTDQTHLVIGVRAFDLFDDRRYALAVLSDILGGSMSSRLFKKVREEMGAAYYVRSTADLGSDVGTLTVSTGIDGTRMVKITEAILEEFKKLRDVPVSEEELNKSKDHLSGRLVLQLETSDEVAAFYGTEEAMSGTIRTPEEILEGIKNVTAKDIMAVAKDIIKNDSLNLAAVGPFKDGDKEDISGILKLD